MNFIAKGSFKAGHDWVNFKKTVTSQNKKNAMDKTFSLIGSEHRLKRYLIKLESVEEVK